ncbi:hypothetical protein QCM80_22945 [Bradyrhizobium sp. SSUT112]|uniref:hypothetical protein n=1 Tax=Bradyrhizobium sp. SSUT112 TaxID=3040604 RepID=UPI00244B6BBB|nr:hypothetical protein [Bradyrhizobium sp. SSUT112]MDH2353495.1 hypothetical protein [Bradyrhizobium sp. SSUT112]
MFASFTRRIALAAAFVASISPAIAQIPNYTLPGQTVVGRSQNGTGPAQAISFNTLIAAMLQSSLTIPTINTNSVVYRGATSGQVAVSAQAVAGTPSIKWPTTSGTVATTATAPILLDAVTGVISCPTCATSTSAATPVLASRALAQTLNLASFDGIITVGYALAGDGGGASFKRITSGNFIDSFVATGSVSAAGTCSTNGTFYGVSPTGGTGGKLQGIVVIAGGVMTSFTPTGSKGNAYTAGNALTIPNGSYNGSTLTCSVSPQWTVATVTPPSASFTDSVGTKFQYVVNNGNFSNVRQFGAKLDRAGKANDGWQPMTKPRYRTR